ncbi:MAG: FecR family protein [Verrucomicrobiota bacterium]
MENSDPSLTSLYDLLVRMQEGSLSPDERKELESRLRDHPGERREFAEFFLLSSAIEESLDESAYSETTATTASGWRNPTSILWSAAALVAVSVIGYLALKAGDRDQTPPIATLVYAQDCEWLPGFGNPIEGQPLRPRKIGLKTGTAVIRFVGGAEILLNERAIVRLRNEGKGELIEGGVVVRAEEGANGFTLVTPSSRVVDLGTEFAARVKSDGKTEVHVLDGQVEYLEGETPKILTEGNAVEIESRAPAAQAVAFGAPRFSELMEASGPQPRADLMWAYDGFHYPEGQLPLASSTQGKGWTGPWRHRLPSEHRKPKTDNTPNLLEIVHGQLNVTWPVLGGKSGMLRLPPGHNVLVRELETPILTNEENVWYFSLMVREEDERVDPDSPGEHTRLTFRDSRDYFGETISFGHNLGFRPTVQVGSGSYRTSMTLMPPEQTTLWIGKVVSQKRGNDEIYFRVYGEEDVLGFTEPTAWHVVARDFSLDARLDRVLLTSAGRSARILDELRIGPTWRSVAPMKKKVPDS